MNCKIISISLRLPLCPLFYFFVCWSTPQTDRIYMYKAYIYIYVCVFFKFIFLIRFYIRALTTTLIAMRARFFYMIISPFLPFFSFFPLCGFNPARSTIFLRESCRPFFLIPEIPFFFTLLSFFPVLVYFLTQ